MVIGLDGGVEVGQRTGEEIEMTEDIYLEEEVYLAQESVVIGVPRLTDGDGHLLLPVAESPMNTIDLAPAP